MKERSWFEEWFDSPYYHLLYENRDEAEAETFIRNIINKLEMPQGAHVLDVGCGKGRHSKTLARYGANVTGIDLSANSIEYAKQFENASLHFEVWDMRVPYRPNGFDYVFNIFSSFGYFEEDSDDYKAIQAFAGDLKPGGTLILDYINTEYAVKHLTNRHILQRGAVQFHIQKKIENGFFKKSIDFLVNGVDHHYEEQLKIINRVKFQEMMTNSGLELKMCFGDYGLNEFNSSQSPRLILIAKKHA